MQCQQSIVDRRLGCKCKLSQISGQVLLEGGGAVMEWQNDFSLTFPLDGKVTKDQGLFSTRLTCNQNNAAQPRLTRQTLAAWLLARPNAIILMSSLYRL